MLAYNAPPALGRPAAPTPGAPPPGLAVPRTGASSHTGSASRRRAAAPRAAAGPGGGARARAPLRRAPRRRMAPRASAEPMQVAYVGDVPAAGAAGGRVLVLVVDHSTAALRALAWALNNLYRPGDTLRLLHVVPPDQVGTPGRQS
jgi:hypothetical protein